MEKGIYDRIDIIRLLLNFRNLITIERFEKTGLSTSIPDYYEEVKRADEVDVEYQDREGKRIQKTLSGIEAVAFQHELDHLDGHLFIEKLNYLKRKKFDKEWKKRHGKFR